jgi:HSP20 family protein
MLWRPNSSSSFEPPYDVIELAEKIIILIEVAGVDPNDFRIDLINKRLIVTGVRHRPALDSQAHHRVEIGYGEFRVVVQLQWSVQQNNVSAIYRDGFLQIDLPRQAERRIQIVNVDKKQGKEADDE